MQYPAHGANAAALYAALNMKMPETVIDVSENVNVFQSPESIRAVWQRAFSLLHTYPHETAEPFTSAVAAFHHVACEHVVVTNGAAEALNVIAQSFASKRVALFEPSFSEYRRTLTQYGCDIVSIVARDIETYTFDEADVHEALQTAHACYICNPNNPTGVLTTRASIEAYMTRYPHCTFVIDEAFLDWTDEKESCLPLVATHDNVIVLRSMTKMYGLAGVRLGYAVTQRAHALRAYLPHWSVSAIAIELGLACLDETAFVARSKAHAAALRTRMTADLEALQCRVTKSAANFLTFSLPARLDPDHFFKTLLERGIVLRHTKNYVGLDGNWFRIAVKDDATWQICLQEMTRYVQNNTPVSSR